MGLVPVSYSTNPTGHSKSQPNQTLFLGERNLKVTSQGPGHRAGLEGDCVGPFCNKFTTGSLKKRKGTKKIGGVAKQGTLEFEVLAMDCFQLLVRPNE